MNNGSYLFLFLVVPLARVPLKEVPCGLSLAKVTITICGGQIPGGIFLTKESRLGLLHCRQILYELSYKGSPYIYMGPYTHTHTHTHTHHTSIYLSIYLEVYLEFSSLFMEAEKSHNLLTTSYKPRRASAIIQSTLKACEQGMVVV